MKLHIENSIVIENNGRKVALNKGEYEFDSASEFIKFIEGLGEQPKEPLIKDEKIRKAVRAWANANGVEQVTVEKDFSSYTFFPTDTSKVDISVWTEPSLSNLSKDKAYTIAELCGEED